MLKVAFTLSPLRRKIKASCKIGHSNEVDIKGIVSRDFRCLQMTLMDRIWVPDVPLYVYYF